MTDTPWLTIVGLGEDGPEGLSAASRAALDAAEVIIGPARHLALLGDVAARVVEWPVPFADGIPLMLEHRGRRVVMLASGDPFWFGAGSSVTRHLERGEWLAHPAPSTFSLAAAQLGWAVQNTPCLGLHAAPLTRLRPHLADGARAIVLLRDGDAVSGLAAYLTEAGFVDSRLHVLEALGGPREQVREVSVPEAAKGGFTHPVAVGLDVRGEGAALTLASGKRDDIFDNDGQITKRPVRALTLSALAPKPGEHLWDIGGGSGSIAIEWLMCHASLGATSVEVDPERAARIRTNSDALGMDRLRVVTGAAPEALAGLMTPDAVFIGGGISDDMLRDVWQRMPQRCRLVANAVTLEGEMLLAGWQANKGGDLLRIDLAQAQGLGRKRGWKAAYPIVQWSVTK